MNLGVSALFLKNHTLRPITNVPSECPLPPIGRSGLAITLHVKGLLPIDAQMPSRQGRKEPEIRAVHGIAIGSERTQTRLEMHCVRHHNRRYGNLVSPT
jgi:hypothetical protein